MTRKTRSGMLMHLHLATQLQLLTRPLSRQALTLLLGDTGDELVGKKQHADYRAWLEAATGAAEVR